MQHCGTMDRSAVRPKAAPLFARLLSKLVLEVLPASLASVIGAVLLAHYQFGHPAAVTGGMAAAPVAASPEMLQLVRDEHDLIRNFLLAQRATQANRYAAADAQPAQSAQVAADAERAAVAARPAVNAAPAKTPAPRARTAATASLAAAAPIAAAPAPQALAGLPNGAVAPAMPEHRSLMARILSVKDHVVSAPLHAVMAIGGIPSWIGHRLGSDDADSSERMFSAAS
jgi:hypothetical protein